MQVDPAARIHTFSNRHTYCLFSTALTRVRPRTAFGPRPFFLNPAERAPPFRNHFFFVDRSVCAQLLHRGLHVHFQGSFNRTSREKQLNVVSSISQEPRRVVDDPVHHPFITKFLTVLPTSAGELLGTRQMVFPHSLPDFCLEKLAQQFASPDVQLGQVISDVCFAVTPTLQTLENCSSIIVSSEAPCTISSHRSRTISHPVRAWQLPSPRNQMSVQLLDMCENARKLNNTGLRSRPIVIFLSLIRENGFVNRSLSFWPTMHRRTKQTQDNAAYQTLQNAPVARVGSTR